MGGGKLKVKVVNGRGLQNKETLSTSDPYYMVELGEQMQKTKYVSSNLNPDWNEEFVLNVKPGQDVVSLSIWDKNTIKKYYFMGYPFISFQDCKKGESKHKVGVI